MLTCLKFSCSIRQFPGMKQRLAAHRNNPGGKTEWKPFGFTCQRWVDHGIIRQKEWIKHNGFMNKATLYPGGFARLHISFYQAPKYKGLKKY